MSHITWKTERVVENGKWKHNINHLVELESKYLSRRTKKNEDGKKHVQQ
jgi:hypothetical protein